jgi:hypothetical protein
MQNNKSTLWTLLLIGLAIAFLTGCGTKGKPAEFEQTAGEMKEGPGVFTGEEGAFVIYDSERGGTFPQIRENKSKESSEETSQKPGDAAPAASGTPAESTQAAADQTPKTDQVTPEAAKEFQEFQEWKKEKQSFKEFQEWKKSAEGKAEYQEFLEWKEWKNYQEWKKQQKP